MIYHFFNGEMTHFIWIIEGILCNAKNTNRNGIEDHFFIILLPEKYLFEDAEKELSKYTLTFNKYTFHNYFFINKTNYEIKNIFKKIDFKKDLIVFHGNVFYFYSYNFLINAVLNKGKIKRMIKIEWGSVKTNTNSLKAKIKHFIYNYLYTNLRNVITLTNEDRLSIIKTYPNAKVKVINYMDVSDTFYKYSKFEEIIKKTKPLKIIVSHSGWQHNNHIDTFKQIEFLKDEDIEIICPLCYGNTDYINLVIQVGESIFKDKFTYFTELKEREEYVKFITNAHVYVSNAKIQTGLFAAIISISNGLKVFLGDNLYEYFKELGCDIYNIQSIDKFSFQDLLTYITKETFEKNKDVIIDAFSNNMLVSKWKIIFNEFK